MGMERYPGERQALGLFLADLRPVAERELGRDSLLFRAICRALRTGSLGHLRQARQLFNHLPRTQRLRLSRGVVGRVGKAAAPAESAAKHPDPAAIVRFEVGVDAGAKGGAPRAGFAEAATLLAPPSRSLVATIPAGTLPSVAAEQLRRIAAMIEADRRLLSARFWRAADGPDDPAVELGSS